jgi:hypothetical protein
MFVDNSCRDLQRLMSPNEWDRVGGACASGSLFGAEPRYYLVPGTRETVPRCAEDHGPACVVYGLIFRTPAAELQPAEIEVRFERRDGRVYPWTSGIFKRVWCPVSCQAVWESRLPRADDATQGSAG